MPRKQNQRQQRLQQRREYEAVLAYNRVVSSRLHVVRIKPNGLPYARLGIVAAAKTLPRAVDRNRGKRLAREAFRAVAPRLVSWDVVVHLRPAVKQHDNAAVRQDLCALLTRIEKQRET